MSGLIHKGWIKDNKKKKNHTLNELDFCQLSVRQVIGYKFTIQVIFLDKEDIFIHCIRLYVLYKQYMVYTRDVHIFWLVFSKCINTLIEQKCVGSRAQWLTNNHKRWTSITKFASCQENIQFAFTTKVGARAPKWIQIYQWYKKREC